MNKQCQKQLDDGSQCSNRAVPGTDFCEEHRRRATFRRVSRTPEPEPGESADASNDETADVAGVAGSDGVGSGELGPGGVGPGGLRRTAKRDAVALCPFDRSQEKPRLPGLRLDQRGIVVGDQAVLRLAQPDRLTQLLGGISDCVELSRITIQRQSTRDVLLFVQPPDEQRDKLSVFYDGIASVARLVPAQVFTGADQVFVAYRDHDAPLGYDVPRPPAKPGRKLRLIAADGIHESSPGKWKPVSVRDVVLQSIPTADRRIVALPPRLFVLTVPALQKTICRYLRSQGLRCRLALIATAARSRGVLMDIETVDATGIPAFVVAWLRSYPRTVVLQDVLPHASRQVLVELGCETPWSWQNAITAFEAGSLIVLSGSSDFPGLCLHPAPVLTDADALLSVRVAKNVSHAATPLKNSTPETCRFQVRFQRDTGPPTAPIALLLEEKELRWLRHLLYRLPASQFHGYRVLPASPFSLLWSEQGPVCDLPFGRPLKRVLDSDLWIPSPLRLVPQLPLSTLTRALAIPARRITVLTDDVRLEVNASSFVPLSELLYSDLNRTPQPLTLAPLRELPDLKWTPPKGFEPDDQPIRSGPSPDAVEPAPRREGRRHTTNASESVGDDAAQLAAALRTQATNLSTTNDSLGAALYLALAGELGNSASLLLGYADNLPSRRDR